MISWKREFFVRTVLVAGLILSGLAAHAYRNVAILVDCSKQSEESLEKSKAAIGQFLKTLADDDLVSLVTYSDRAAIRLHPRQAARIGSQIHNVLDKLEIGDGAALFEGLSFASVIVRRHVPVCTDTVIKVFGPGQATIGYASPEALARLALSLKKEGIRIEGLPQINLDRIAVLRRPVDHPLLIDPPPVGCPMPHADDVRRRP